MKNIKLLSVLPFIIGFIGCGVNGDDNNDIPCNIDSSSIAIENSRKYLVGQTVLALEQISKDINETSISGHRHIFIPRDYKFPSYFNKDSWFHKSIDLTESTPQYEQLRDNIVTCLNEKGFTTSFFHFWATNADSWYRYSSYSKCARHYNYLNCYEYFEKMLIKW